jgi:flagellin
MAGTTGAVSGNGSASISFGSGTSTSIEFVVDEGTGATGNAWDFSAVITASNDSGRQVTSDGEGERFGLATITPISASGSISTAAGAASALTSIKSAIENLASRRAKVGANLARLRAHVDELGTLQQNLDAAISRIADADIAVESTQFARNSILVQSGTAMLAQANLLPESALRLIGG